MMIRSTTIAALVAILAASATLPSSDAYMFGPRVSSGRIGGVSYFTTQRQPQFGSGISFGIQPQQFYSSPMTTPARRSASAVPLARPQKNPFQSMLDFYSTMIWIARPDLFLYDRLARFAWENVTKNLKKLEEEKLPENVLNKALKEMQNDLSKIQNAYADVADTQRRMYIQKQQAEAAADEWYRRAQYALSRGQEEISKEALFRRQELLDGAAKLQEDIQAQDETRTKLYKAFQALEESFREKVSKRDDLMERAKTAKRMTQINDMLNDFNSKTLADDAFDNLERKVETMEAAAEVSSSPFDWFTGNRKKAPLTEDERLEMEFAKLEKEDAIKREMKGMRGGKTNHASSSFQTDEEWLDQLIGAPRRY